MSWKAIHRKASEEQCFDLCTLYKQWELGQASRGAHCLTRCCDHMRNRQHHVSRFNCFTRFSRRLASQNASGCCTVQGIFPWRARFQKQRNAEMQTIGTRLVTLPNDLCKARRHSRTSRGLLHSCQITQTSGPNFGATQPLPLGCRQLAAAFCSHIVQNTH